MSLLVKAQREGQTIARVTPETAAWRYVGFAAYRMSADEVVHVFEPAREVCIVVLAGAVDIETADRKWSSLGSRDSVFEDAAPYAVYLPPGVRTSTTSKDSATSVCGKISQTYRVLSPLPRVERFICEGSISRAGNPPLAGALATPTSASRSARTVVRTPGGRYTAYGAASSNTLSREPRLLHL